MTESMQQRERQRIEFVRQRGNDETALAFCVQGIVVYGQALRTGYSKAYAQELQASIACYLKEVTDLYGDEYPEELKEPIALYEASLRPVDEAKVDEVQQRIDDYTAYIAMKSRLPALFKIYPTLLD